MATTNNDNSTFNNNNSSFLRNLYNMKNILIIIAGIIIGWLICWFICFRHFDDDYTKHWNASKYKHYDCDNFFNTFKTEVSDRSGRFAGIKIQKNDLIHLVDSCSSTSDVYLALVLDDDHNKILLVAGAANGTSNWNTKPGSVPNPLQTTDSASKDTIWYVLPDGPNTNSKVGYIIHKDNKLVSYDAATKSESNIFVNKILKTILPGRDVVAGTVQGCPKNCPTVIATDLKPH
ncbi:MAG: hypothetical protein ABI723_07055 [Bacteroidia bacterium]